MSDTTNLDTEHDEAKDLTFELVRNLGDAAPHLHLGCVIQAYRHDARRDLERSRQPLVERQDVEFGDVACLEFGAKDLDVGLPTLQLARQVDELGREVDAAVRRADEAAQAAEAPGAAPNAGLRLPTIRDAVDGATVDIRGAWSNPGTISTGAGTLALGGTVSRNPVMRSAAATH